MNADPSASMIERARPGRRRLVLSSLRFRLLLLVLLAVLPALGLILYTDAERRRMDIVDAEQEALKLAMYFSRDYQHLIESGRQLLTAVGRSPEVLTRNTAGCTAVFSALLKDFPAYANLGAAAPDGTVFCSVLPLTTDTSLGDRPHFRRAIETRQFVVSDVVTGRITKQLTIALVAPVVSADNRVGSVVFLGLDQAWVTRRWDEIGRPAGARLIVFDRHGTLLWHSANSQGSGMEDRGDWQVVREALARGVGVVRAEGPERDPYFWGFAGLRGAGSAHLFAAVGVPETAVLAGQRALMRRQLAGLAVVAGLTLVAAWVGGDVLIRRRVGRLVAATRRLAAGDLKTRSGFARDADELGELADAFDDMARSLGARQAQLGDVEVRRYSAETALEESEELFSLVLDGIRDYAIVRLDAGGRVATWHGGARHLFGYPATEVVGKGFATMLPADAEPGAADQLVDMATVHGRAESEQLLLRSDGSHFLANIIVTSLWADGRVSGFAMVVRDVTAARRIEEQRKLTNRELAVRNAVIAAVSGSLELEQVLADLRTMLPDLLQAAGGTIFVYNSAQGRETPVTHWGMSEASLSSLCAATSNYRVRAEKEKGPVFIEGAEAPAGWWAYVCVPLMIADTPHGAMELLTTEPLPRGLSDGAFLWVVGRNIAMGIYNARLYREVRTTGLRRQRLSQRLLAAQETERRRIAHELHDEIGQALTSIKINLQMLQRVPDEIPAARLDDSIEMVTRLLQQVRDLSLNLRPSVLDDWGLVAAIRWYLERRAANLTLKAEIVVENPDERFPPEIETVCFRVVQEAVTNAVRHAHAGHLTVELQPRGGFLALTIRDDGRGFIVADAQRRASRGESLGILGMEERVHLVGGTLLIKSAPGHGTAVSAHIPLPSPTRRGGTSE